MLTVQKCGWQGLPCPYNLGEPITTYIYLGKQRLAMLGGTVTGSFGCNLGQKAVESAKANWAIIIILPVIVILALKYRKNKYVVSLLVVIGGSAIILIAMNEARSDLEYSEAIYFYHNDHLGTPQVMTDEDGDVVWDAAYEPFGKIQSYATQAITNRFRFPGQYEDDMTGMYYNHHRYYMPEAGRYNKVDDLTIAPFLYYSINQWLLNIYRKANNRQLIIDIYGYPSNYNPNSKYYIVDNTNSYYYTYNNPIIVTDPDGQFCLPCIGIGAVVIGGVGYAAYRFLSHSEDFANGRLDRASNINQQLGRDTLSGDQLLYLLDQRNQNIRDGIPELGNLVEDGMDLVGYPYASPTELLLDTCRP